MIKLKSLLFENSDQELLILLEEANQLIMEMWKVADDSVADYTLQLETAVNFANKAFQTRDRLDIFKALQKACDVLEREEAGEENEDGYDDIVNRIKRAMQ